MPMKKLNILRLFALKYGKIPYLYGKIPYHIMSKTNPIGHHLPCLLLIKGETFADSRSQK